MYIYVLTQIGIYMEKKNTYKCISAYYVSYNMRRYYTYVFTSVYNKFEYV